MNLKFIGSIIFFLGLLQFILGLNVGEFHVAKRHLILLLTGAIMIIIGLFLKKKNKT